ncbi:MAG: choice-of-anchor D domain-containing protein [Candidatus Kapaibacterium sp.]
MRSYQSNSSVRLYIAALVFSLIHMVPHVQAQYFTVYGIDDTNFPRMRARFVALDAAGKELRNFSNNEFDVRENGISMQGSLSIDCKDTAVEPAANVVLILDRSGSMETIVDTATKATRMDWVISGANTFVNTFKFNPPSEVAVISFGTLPTFESPFRTTAPPLVDVISKLRPQGGTNYNPPMLDTSFGAIKLLAGQRPGVRRIVIFLTDGQPDKEPLTDSITKLCNRQSIQFYAITIGTKMNKELQTIAQRTGGKAFEANTKEDLIAIYRLIALETEIKQNCFLEWTAPYSCNQSGRIRELSVTFKRTNPPITSEPQYIAPLSSVANISVSSSSLFFGDPAPGGSTTQTVTIKAENAPLIVTALTPTPSGFFTVLSYGGGRSLPDTIKIGQTRDVTIQFTQGGQKAYRQASLIVSGSPCPPTVSLFGGLSTVQVVSPNGGELYSTCDTVNIRWAGVDPKQSINIFYALDGDAPNPTWQLLKQNATGLSYKWYPAIRGKKLRIRMTAQPAPSYLWTRSLGGTLLDTCRSIALDASQNFVNIAGIFSDTLKVSNSTKPFPSYGGRDAFVGRFDTDGNLVWIQTAGGSGDEGCAAVATDNSGGIYATGYFTSKAVQFGSTQLLMPPLDQINFFVARYDATGNATWVRTGGGTTTSNGYAYADSISYEGDSIYVYGRFKNKLRINGYAASPGYLELNRAAGTTVPPYKFTASFDKSGNIGSLVEGYRTHKYTDSTESDKNGNLYDAGYFKGTQNNGGAAVNLTSRGDYDCFIRKFGGQPGSSDSSDAIFAVSSPQLSFKSTVLNCPTTSVGQSASATFSAELCNSGDIPLLIQNNGSIITGPHKEDFKLTTNYDGKVLYPGDCLPIEISFQPQTIDGARTATLQISSTCGPAAVVELQAVALPPCRFEPNSPYIGCQSVNLTKKVTDPCIIRNMAANDYGGTITLIGVNPDEFKVFLPKTGDTISFGKAPVPFTLQKNGACLAAEILFTPKGSGTRTAVLKFDVPFECGSVAQINLVGCGIAPQVKVDPVDFKLRRVRTTNRLTATISNPDSLDALVSKVSLAAADANFSIDPASIPTLPYNLQKGASFTVNIDYVPQSVGVHTNTINVDVAGNTTPLQGSVRGEGFIPSMISYDLDFAASPVNVPPPTKVMVIRNTSSNAPLQIKSVGAPDNPRFTYDRTPAADTVLAPGDSLQITVTLTPAAGANVGRVTISTDAAEGPSTSPKVDTVITLRGEGLQVDVDPQPAAFGDVLSCDSTQARTISITNNGVSAIDVTVGTSGDAAAFDVQPAPGTVNLTSGQKATFTVRFRGTAGNHSMDLEFTLPTGTVKRTFSANGISTAINVTANATPFQVNAKSNYPITISTAPLNGVKVNRIEFDVQLDINSVLFDADRFAALYASPVNGWTWTYSQSGTLSPIVRIVGTNAAGFTGGTETFNLPLWLLQVYVESVPITITWASSQEYPCLVPSITNGSILAKIACFAAGSRIELGSTSFAMVMSPNPVTNGTVHLDYGIGMSDVPCSIDLYTSLGEHVMNIKRGTLKSGVYSEDIDVSGITSGVYVVRMNAGPYTDSRMINISR